MFSPLGSGMIQNLYLFSFMCSTLIELLCNAGALIKEVDTIHVKFATRSG
jgi:hypothetical protein